MTKTNGDNNGQGTTVHLSLQGKGGVGKSLVASILSQYFVSKDRAVHAVDADPVNQTLAQYEALVVERLNLLKNGNVDLNVEAPVSTTNGSVSIRSIKMSNALCAYSEPPEFLRVSSGAAGSTAWSNFAQTKIREGYRVSVSTYASP